MAGVDYGEESKTITDSALLSKVTTDQGRMPDDLTMTTLFSTLVANLFLPPLSLVQVMESRFTIEEAVSDGNVEEIRALYSSNQVEFDSTVQALGCAFDGALASGDFTDALSLTIKLSYLRTIRVEADKHLPSS